jgi:glycosyltransferase involved in cell wall biosynthesis
MELLVTVDLPAMRMLLWSHVAGHNAPQVFSRALIELPDLFVVASPYSLHAPALRGDEKHVRLVFTSAGTEHVSQIVPEEHDGFIIGYIGTVDYCKMHPDFLSMSLAADIPDAHFVVCGGDHHEEIGATAGDRFTFCGRVPDIRPYLSRFDVFGYPLRRDHYGTGEQVLIEAQAAGVVPVVLTGGAESYVVKHEETGLVVDEVDYPRALERLHTDPMLRARLSKAARKHALETFALERTVSSWHEVFSEALRLGKRQRKWSGQVASTGADLFLASVEKGAEQFSATIESAPLTFRSATRGSPFHYQTFFPEDPRLNRWCGRLQQGA